MAANRGYEDILDILGAQCSIIPIGDPAEENAARTTVTTRGNGDGDGIVFTYSEAITDFDLPPLELRTPYRIPVVRWNSITIDEEADTPDIDYWTRALAPFSFVVWIRPRTLSGADYLISRIDNTSASEEREWSCHLSSGTPRINIWDESANAAIGRSAPAIPLNQWSQLGYVYDGNATSAACKIYRNGLQVDDGDDETGGFTSSENLVGLKTMIGHLLDGGGSPGSFYEGEMYGGSLGPAWAQKELSAIDMRRLYDIGNLYRLGGGFPPRRRRGR